MIGELAGLLTAACWSGSSLAFAGASQRVGSLHVNLTRLIIAAILLLLTIAVLGIPLGLSPFQFLNLALSGFIGLVFGDSFLFKSYEYNGARLSMLIMSLAPAITAILAYFVLGEVLSFLGILGIIVTLTGIALVVLERREGESPRLAITKRGLLYGFFGAVGQGVGLIFARMAFNEGSINGFAATLVRIIAAIVILWPLLYFTGRLRNAVGSMRSDPRALRLTTVGAILGPYFGITLSLISIEYTKVGIAATLMATVPILMLPLVRFLYHERLSRKAIAGAFIAVAGVAALFLR